MEPRFASYRCLIALVAAAALAGCGTNVRTLLQSNGELTRQADWLLVDASPAQADRLLAAESTRAQACVEIDHATMQWIEKKGVSFGEQFGSDLMQVAALVLPFGPVEDCAVAQRQYEATVRDLSGQIGGGSSEIAATPAL
jgi:hypothetical protein